MQNRFLTRDNEQTYYNMLTWLKPAHTYVPRYYFGRYVCFKYILYQLNWDRV